MRVMLVGCGCVGASLLSLIVQAARAAGRGAVDGSRWWRRRARIRPPARPQPGDQVSRGTEAQRQARASATDDNGTPEQGRALPALRAGHHRQAGRDGQVPVSSRTRTTRQLPDDSQLRQAADRGRAGHEELGSAGQITLHATQRGRSGACGMRRWQVFGSEAGDSGHPLQAISAGVTIDIDDATRAPQFGFAMEGQADKPPRRPWMA